MTETVNVNEHSEDIRLTEDGEYISRKNDAYRAYLVQERMTKISKEIDSLGNDTQD